MELMEEFSQYAGAFSIGRGHMDNQHSTMEMPLTKGAQPMDSKLPTACTPFANTISTAP